MAPRSRRIVPILLICGTLLVPAAAEAGTARIAARDVCDQTCSKYGQTATEPVVDFAAQPGEANRLVLRREGGDFILRDDGAPLAAGQGCTAIDDRTARCPVAGARILGVDLGDGDDAVRVDGDLNFQDPNCENCNALRVAGGPGKDALTGGPGHDRLDGGPDADRIDGGGGEDWLDYSDRTTPVTVDLVAGTSAEGGTTDALANLEVAIGGAGGDDLTGSNVFGRDGDDTLTGTDGADVLHGGLGDDTVEGGGGDDTLTGHGGADEVSGGSGDDELSGDTPEENIDDDVGPSGADDLDGGSGDDVLTDGGAEDGDEMAGGTGNDRLSAGDGATRQRGGSGRDKLTGSVEADRLDGGAGGDTIRGKAGKDRIKGGSGRDKVKGDGGADRIDVRDGERDTVNGGGGRDRVRADRRDRVR